MPVFWPGNCDFIYLNWDSSRKDNRKWRCMGLILEQDRLWEDEVCTLELGISISYRNFVHGLVQATARIRARNASGCSHDNNRNVDVSKQIMASRFYQNEILLGWNFPIEAPYLWVKTHRDGCEAFFAKRAERKRAFEAPSWSRIHSRRRTILGGVARL